MVLCADEQDRPSEKHTQGGCLEFHESSGNRFGCLQISASAKLDGPQPTGSTW